MSTTSETRLGAPAADTARDHASAIVAARVRREHATLRALLDDVERAGVALRARRPGSMEELLRSIWELHLSFEEHLAMEEELVAPILRATLPFGEMRADALLVEHNEQRWRLLELVDETERDSRSIDALVDLANELVTIFRADMLAEENNFASVLDVT